MIYTTYYANLRKLPDSIIPIAISRGVPNWFQGKTYSKLAPPWSLVSAWKENGKEDEYREVYSKILEQLDVDKVVEELYDLAGANDIALVCYEKPSDFCHRHMVKGWLNHNGYGCEEWR